MNPEPETLERAACARSKGCFARLGTGHSDAFGFAVPGAILARGKDAARFLHSQVTNEVEALEPGEGNFSARVTRQGQLLHLFSLHRLEQVNDEPPSYLLLLERDGVAGLMAALDEFVFSDDVNFRDVSDRYLWFTLQGRNAERILSASLDDGEPSEWKAYAIRHLHSATTRDDPTWVIARSLTGDPGFLVATPREAGAASQPIAARLEAAAREADFEILDEPELSRVLEILRIEGGQLRVSRDIRGRKCLLPETGLEQQAVSYTKGCYLGQEVIARVRTYGALAFGLRGLVFECTQQDDLAQQTALLERLPEIGAELRTAGSDKPIGQIVSRTVSPLLEGPIAFAYLDKTHRTPGRDVEIEAQGGAITARVTLLPFYSAPDRDERVAFLYDRAIRIFAQGREEQALGILEQALELDPGFSDGYEAVGVILGRCERFHEAIDIFKRLEELAPREPMVNTNLSLYYMKIGDKATAESHAAKAMQKSLAQGSGGSVDDAQLDASRREQEHADALRKQKMFEQVLEIDSEDEVALYGLGNALAVLEQWERAEGFYARASDADPNNSAVYLAHGKVLEQLARTRDAESVYRAGMEIASRKGDLMPLKEMEHRVLLLSGTHHGETGGGGS